MRRGVWHQNGFNSQKVTLKFLQAGLGVGAIISPKDLAWENAASYAEQYRESNAGILLDPQFYVPEYSAGRLSTYQTSVFRKSISALGKISDSELSALSRALEAENRSLATDAVISPAIPYESARNDIIDLNARLFRAAKVAGDAIGVPTYATVVIGQSTTTSAIAYSILSSATALSADGWYYGFEFESGRLPTDSDSIFRYCAAGLTLACTGKPVLHMCAGPLAPLSFGAGARASGIGFWQNLWGFERARWQPATEQGGGGGAPPRFFSVPLWGTIIYPDEIVLLSQLSPTVRAQVMSHSPYSTPISGTVVLDWKKWDAYMHLVHMISTTVTPFAEWRDARRSMDAAITILVGANALHSTIKKSGLDLKDETDSYQSAWAAAGTRMLKENSDDYDYLTMIGGP